MIQERLDALRVRLKQEKIDYYVIPTADYHNSEYVSDYFKIREYFSGFTGSNGTLVIGPEESGLWTDGRYFIQAEKELSGSGLTLFRMQEEGVPTIKEYLQKNVKEGECVGFDGRVISASYGKELEEALADKKVVFRYQDDIAGSLMKDRAPMPASPVWVLPEEISGKNVDAKLAQIREEMEKFHCTAHLLTKLDDLMWLLNIRGSDVECNPVAMSYCFLTKSACYLFVQKQAMDNTLRDYAGKWGITLKDYSEITEFLKAETVECVLLDEENVNYTLYCILRDKAKIVSRKNPSERLKAVKNPVELSHIEKVYLTDSVVLTKFIYWLKKNIGKLPLNEYCAAMQLDNMRREAEGFLDLSFPTISGYLENAAMMHYEATETENKELKPEGMFLIDSGGQYMGGTTDVTRTIVLGKISEEIKRNFTAVAVGMLRLSDAKFLYGCTGRNLDILARGAMWEMGIDYKCGTGHGVGYMLNVHEGPQNVGWRYVEDRKEAVLEAGMILSDEPGVYMEGSYGIRTENIIVTRNGEKNEYGQFMYFDMLTFVPIDLDGIEPSYMQPADRKRLNAYHKQVFEKVGPYLEEEERAWLAEATRAV